MDDYFVVSGETFFGTVNPRTQQIRGRAISAVERAASEIPEPELLELDKERWASDAAGAHALEAPSFEVNSASIVPLKEVEVDCTGVPGITYTTSEYGRVVRPGYRMQVRVPFRGDIDLMREAPPDTPPLKVEVEDGYVARTWDWPEVKGSEAFNKEVETFLRELQAGADQVSQRVSWFNETLEDKALKEIEARREKVVNRQGFLGAMKLPVKEVESPPRRFSAPPIREKKSPAREVLRGELSEAVGDAGLNELYEHILEVIRASARGLERTPGAFSSFEEPQLRDHMLVTLNTHYEGAGHAEAFNRSGKTDLLIRVLDRNAFIGECKWWDGPKAFDAALDQLFGYTTWRDSRLALIFYVRAKGASEIVEKARAQLAERPEFLRWEAGAQQRELRCRVQWPDDASIEATLTTFFVHLPPANESAPG